MVFGRDIINSNQVWVGGQISPPCFKNLIYLEPKVGLTCKFKFVRCLETNMKILVSLDHEGTLEALFY